MVRGEEAGWGRVLAAGVPAVAAANILGQVVAALVAWGFDSSTSPAAVAMVVLAVGALGTGLGRAQARTRVIALTAACVAAVVVLVFTGLSPIASGAALLPALGSGLLLPRLTERLPADLDGWLCRRPFVAALWSLAALLAVANTARLTVFMVDDSRVWASVFPPLPESARHQCAAAYVRAAELAAAGADNVYEFSHYGVFASRENRPETDVDGLQPYLSDPFEYPPIFLVLPRAGLAVSNDFDVLRATWFAIQAIAFLLVGVVLAAWIGGRAGAVGLLLLPALLLSGPLMLNWQWGQFHATAVALSIAAMLAFAARREWLGGGLLAAGIGTKLFPGILLLHLVASRAPGTRLRPVLATLLGGAALVGVALVIVGLQPFVAFLDYQLPRIASGEAFRFTETNPDNYSLYGLVFKLRTLGVPGAGRTMAVLVSWIYMVVVLVLAVISGRRARDRAGMAMTWLALISLAALRSPFAPTYAGISALWLLSIWAGAQRGGSLGVVGLVSAWILLQGFPPMFSATGNAIASLPGQAVAIAVPLLLVWPRRSRSALDAGEPDAVVENTIDAAGGAVDQA